MFPEWQRVLKVNGLLMFSTLGPDTLKELQRRVRAKRKRRTASRRSEHTIEFVDMHDLGDMLVESGFEIPVMDQEVLTITYKSPESLLNGRAPLGRLSARARGRTRMRRAQSARRASRRRSKPAVAPTARSR